MSKDTFILSFLWRVQNIIFTLFSCFIISSIINQKDARLVSLWGRNVLRRNNRLGFVVVEELVPYCDYWYHHNNYTSALFVNNNDQTFVCGDGLGNYAKKKNVMQLLVVYHSCSCRCWFVVLITSTNLKILTRTDRWIVEKMSGMINTVRFHVYVVCDYLER